MMAGQSLSNPSPEVFGARGRIVLGCGFAFSLLLTIYCVWAAPLAMLVLPGLLFVGFALSQILQRPRLGFGLLLVSFALVLSPNDGIELHEVIFYLCYVSFIGLWFVCHLFVYRTPFLRSKEDAALFLFLLTGTSSLGLTVLHQGDFVVAAQEWMPMTVLALYFPLKEQCRKDRRMPFSLAIAFGILAAVLLLKNIYAYYVDLYSAVDLRGIMSGRERDNERLFMVMTLGMSVLLLYARNARHRLLAGGGFLFFFLGVVIGLSRTLWVSFALGLGVIFLLMDRKYKLRLILFVVAGLAAASLLAYLLLGNIFGLVMTGLSNRMASLSTATTEDVSMVNRLVEWETAMALIKQSPIIGHGFGVRFHYYSLVYDFTQYTSHIHNTALTLLYQHGIVGLGLMLFFGACCTWQSICLFRDVRQEAGDRLLGLVMAGSMFSLALAAMTESLLHVDEGALILALPTAVIMGIRQRPSSAR